MYQSKKTKREFRRTRIKIFGLVVFLLTGSAALFVRPSFADTNQTPTVLPINDQVINEGDYLYLTITAEDPDCGNSGSDDYSCPNDTLAFTADNLPLGALLNVLTTDGGGLVPNTERQRRLVWLPLPDQQRAST